MICLLLRGWHLLVGHRWYYSTSCRHGEHEHCRCTVAVTGDAKTPGTCKWCPARCICRCHRKPPR